MDTDLLLVIGIVILGFTIPPILGAIFDGRPPKKSAISVVIAGGMITFAIMQHPGGYSFGDVPNAFVRVIGKYL